MTIHSVIFFVIFYNICHMLIFLYYCTVSTAWGIPVAYMKGTCSEHQILVVYILGFEHGQNRNKNNQLEIQQWMKNWQILYTLWKTVQLINYRRTSILCCSTFKKGCPKIQNIIENMLSLSIILHLSQSSVYQYHMTWPNGCI